MSSVGPPNYHDESLQRGERIISMVSNEGLDVEPTTLRRSVSAFGEITVMPVVYEDEELKAAVEVELYD